MKSLNKIGFFLLLTLMLSSCGMDGRGIFDPHPTRRGRVIITDRRYDDRRYDNRRYDSRRQSLSGSEFSRLYYRLRMTSSSNSRRRIIREIPNYITLSRSQASDILYLERNEKEAIKLYKEIVPHFRNRSDAESVASSFMNRKYREEAFKIAQRVPRYSYGGYSYPSRNRW
ncbi:hypothetical protein QYZ87_10695 [Porphyromonadaceae bacterium W3.11]|nr:hypothetical protein [Porphyromonadaceae bacterium W3.11]